MSAGAIIHFPANREKLSAIRDFIHMQAVDAGASPAAVNDLVQAVDEAATNVMVHGYHDKPGIIEIEVVPQPASIKIYVRDNAPVFDPTNVSEPDISLPLEERPIGGLGIHLIRQCVDEFIHRPLSPIGNELLFIKRWENQAPEPQK